MNYYPAERLGEHQSLTKEGFLLCTDVPLARTGMMLYGPGEVPINPSPGDGVIYVHREPEEVFRPETMASMLGKPVVVYHPSDDVTPHNWKERAVGTVIAVRRGIVPNDDLFLGDALITDITGIKAIREDGLREVSCGYDAVYEEMLIPGHGKQKNIVYNHLALVDSGRCGPRCSIGDNKSVRTGDCNMTWLDRVRAAFKAKDEAALDAALAEAPKELTDAEINKIVAKVRDAKTGDTHPDDCECKTCKKMGTIDAAMKDLKKSVDSIDARMKKMEDAESERKREEEEEERKARDNKEIEGELEEEAPEGSGDKARKARDSAYLADSFQETIAMAEIITPGVAIPTFDSAAPPKKSYLEICKFRKQVLEVAGARPEYKLFIDNVLKGRTLDSCPCDSLRMVFRSVGEFAKNFNNSRRETNDGNRATTDSKPKRMTIADLNKMNREFYAGAAKQ